MPKLQSVAINAALLFGAVLLMGFLLEVLLRVSGMQVVAPQNPPIYRASDDPELSYTLIPSHRARAYGSTVTTNALGFRSPELPAGVRPLVLLGDSLVFGYGLQDRQTVGHFLQELLPERHVLSAGVNGYTITQERRTYEKTLAPLHPEALILVFMPNDMDEALTLDPEGYFRPLSDHTPLTYTQKLERDLHRPGTLPIPFKAFLQTKSALFGFLERTTKGLPFRSHAEAPGFFDDPITDEQRALYAREFERLSNAAGDIPRLLVVWPENLYHFDTRAFLADLAAKHGWSFLDLYEVYGNRYDSLGWDGHPSSATNRKTAEILKEAMRVSWE